MEDKGERWRARKNSRKVVSGQRTNVDEKRDKREATRKCWKKNGIETVVQERRDK